MAPSSYIEVRLDWLISKSVHRQPHRRLNGIENMLANLAKLVMSFGHFLQGRR